MREIHNLVVFILQIAFIIDNSGWIRISGLHAFGSNFQAVEKIYKKILLLKNYSQFHNSFAVFSALQNCKKG